MIRKIAILDDEVVFLRGLNEGLAEAGFSVSAFSEPDRLLTAIDAGYDFDVIVVDYKMPKITGIDFLKMIKQKNVTAPVIFISGYGTVPVAVDAMNEGAVHFLEKPIEIQKLATIIEAVTADNVNFKKERGEIERFEKQYKSLPKSQQRVMDLAVEGYTNKEIASRLNLTVRTVDTYRMWIMAKMSVESFAELVRKATIMTISK
jgi:two-component system response regulator FixJ